MKKWGRRKEPKALTTLESTGPAGASGVSNGTSMETRNVEENYGLFTLHDLPRDVANALDIVAVHGLGGNWQETWTDTQTRKNWLKDFLPYQLKSQGYQIRVMSYGYDSGGILSKSVSDIEDVAHELLVRLQGQRVTGPEKSRPILFVAHSLGGVVVKKTMVVAHERSTRNGDLRDKVRAFVFLGVPHRGSDLAFWYNYVIEISKLAQLGFAGNPKFVAPLQRNAEMFANISTQCIERLQAQSIDIRTFYESDKLHNQLIVDKHSAVLNSWNETATQISATNHKTICKFPTENAQTYLPILQAISEIGEQALVQRDLVPAAPARDISARDRLSIIEPHSTKAGDLGLFEYAPYRVGYGGNRHHVLYAERTPTGKTKKTQDFSKAYLEPPRVLVSISHLDFSKDHGLRARANVSEVTPVSFRPVLETWADSLCYGMSGSWLEVAPGDIDIQTGRCNTYGFDKTTTDEMSMRIVRYVKFYNQYAEVPDVICYLVTIDSSELINHRMHVESQNVTTSGFELHFISWADSIIYELEAEWLAFSKDRNNIYAIPETIVGENTMLRFPEKKFERPPTCFLALSYLDIQPGNAVSVKVLVRDVNESFVMIGRETWNDAFDWQTRITGVAIA